MVRRGLLGTATLLAALAAAPCPGGETGLSDVPAYLWHRGCAPTAGGMLLGYWDAHGYEDLIPGSNDWDTNQAAIEDAIASQEHVDDYWGSDDPPPHHPDNCVADFMETSRGSLGDGVTYLSKVDNGLRDYLAWKDYPEVSSYNVGFWSGFWDVLVQEIDQGRPLLLYVDSGSDGLADHFITAVGYDDTGGAQRYLAYNTYDRQVHTHEASQVAPGQLYGIHSATLVTLSVPGDANRDGRVGDEDFSTVLSNWGQGSSGWTDGDFSGDGYVGDGDFSRLVGHWGEDLTAGAIDGMSTGGARLPEPATLGLMAAGLALVGWTRRRRRKRT